ncbi:MAG: hypothetical protein EBU33_10100 [Sphingobacteriia bacterium]|nr:hypothetical protein [Sphingobacteriia bacterium]
MENKSLFDAVTEVDTAAKERQAAEAPQGTPQTMLGLAPPGMGAEQPVAPPQGAQGQPDIQSLLAQLGG